MPGQTDGPEPVGSVAEEAAKLIGALSGWAKEHGDEHLATGAPECTWCPVCRTVAAVRQTSPEVRAHLTSAATSFLLAVSGMMATHTPSGDAGVERIRLDDDAGDEWPEDDA